MISQLSIRRPEDTTGRRPPWVEGSWKIGCTKCVRVSQSKKRVGFCIINFGPHETKKRKGIYINSHLCSAS